jgi:hypothetical protein
MQIHIIFGGGDGTPVSIISKHSRTRRSALFSNAIYKSFWMTASAQIKYSAFPQSSGMAAFVLLSGKFAQNIPKKRLRKRTVSVILITSDYKLFCHLLPIIRYTLNL